jgi:hypothetical protein
MGHCNDACVWGEVSSPTYRTVLRMLRAGTGIKTSKNTRRKEAMKEIACLAGSLVDAKLLFTRSSAAEAIRNILTKYIGRPVSLDEASKCFYSSRSRSIEKTEFLTEILSGRRWPPRAPILASSDEFGYDRIPESYSDWYPRGLRDVDQWVEYIASLPDTARIF